MENQKPEEKEQIIKDIRNLFRLKKELNYTTIKDITNIFRLEKETKAIKDRIIRDIKRLFEHEEQNYYKWVRVNNFWSNNYIAYESNSDKNNPISVEKDLKKFRPYLKDITNNLKKSETWKIQLIIANNFVFSIDNDKQHVMHSNTDNIGIMIIDEADEFIKEPFDLLKSRYQNNLESMKGSEFNFDYVHFLYYECLKINPNCGRSYKIILIR